MSIARTETLPPRLNSWSRPGLQLWLVLAACTGILIYRRPDAFTTPQFWAEDGYFYYEDYVSGFGVLFNQYNGYLLIIPRLIAAICGRLDPAWIPAAYVYSALAFTLYVAALPFSPRFPLKPAAGFALAVVLVPDLPDVLLNPTNLQSILVGGYIALLIFQDPRSRREYLHDCVALIALGLTGAFSVVFAPLFLARAALRRTKASLILGGITLATAAIQLGSILTHPLPPPTDIEPVRLDYVLAVPGNRVMASLFTGYHFLPVDEVALLSGLGLLVIAGVLWLAWKEKDHRVERCFLAAVFFALLAAAIYRILIHLPSLTKPGYGSRYFYGPQLIVLWLLLNAQRDYLKWRWVYRGLLILFLVVNLPRLREPALPNEEWGKYVGSIRAGDAVTIPINPTGWKIPLPERRRDK